MDHLDPLEQGSVFEVRCVQSMSVDSSRRDDTERIQYKTDIHPATPNLIELHLHLLVMTILIVTLFLPHQVTMKILKLQLS